MESWRPPSGLGCLKTPLWGCWGCLTLFGALFCVSAYGFWGLIGFLLAMGFWAMCLAAQG